MTMEDLMRRRLSQTRPMEPPSGAQPTGPPPPLNVDDKHALYLRSNDPNSEIAYSILKSVPECRKSIEVFNITMTGIRPEWLKGTPCIVVKQPGGRQTTQYGSGALHVLRSIVESTKERDNLHDAHHAAIPTVDGLLAAPGPGAAACGFELPNDMDYQGVTKTYSESGKMKDAESSVQSLIAARNRQDIAIKASNGQGQPVL